MNQKQKYVIDMIQSIVSGWKSTNDINSPTMYLDVTEELKKLEYDGISIDAIYTINDALFQILDEIKNINEAKTNN